MEPLITSSQPNETGTTSPSPSLVGSTKQQADSSLSPFRLQAPAAKGSPSLVYVRRKPESVHGKINTASTCNAADSPSQCKASSEAGEKTELQWEEKTASPVHIEVQKEVSSNSWTERYNRLQEYLKYLDQSGLKDYAKRYQAFSVEDLNKHAVNLEKRAIRLSLEEALQSQRVRDLNLLGKPSQ